MDTQLIVWAARNRHIVKPITFHCPTKNAEFHERVKAVRMRLAAGYVGVDQALEKSGRRQDRKFNYD